MTNAAENIANLLAQIASGRTVIISTMTRAWKIDAKVAGKFVKAGLPVLKSVGNSAYMANGSKYVCIDYAHIQTV